MEWTDLILAGVGAFLGMGAVGFYANNLISLLKEVAELISTLGEALSDKKITRDEIKQILEDFDDVVDALKAFKRK